MLFLLILYYRKQINYDLSDCLHASVTELRHICISKRWGSKLPLMKAAKVNINKRILSTLWGFLHCSICSPYVEMKKFWNTSLVPIQWAKPHDATKMPQLLCVKLEDPKKFTSQALRRSRAVIHLGWLICRGMPLVTVCLTEYLYCPACWIILPIPWDKNWDGALDNWAIPTWVSQTLRLCTISPQGRVITGRPVAIATSRRLAAAAGARQWPRLYESVGHNGKIRSANFRKKIR